MKFTYLLLPFFFCVGCNTLESEDLVELGAYNMSPEAASSERLAVRGTRIAGDAPAAVQGGLAGNVVAAAPAVEPTQVQLQQRIVIYSAGVRVVVVSISESLAAVNKIAKDFDGYMQESSADSITIRVPAAKFDDAVAAISKLGEVIDRNIRASDITEQMIDLKIRLETATKTRARLLELLAKAEKMEDTLKIETELQRLTTEIETIQGKIRYYESQAAMSTIRVDFASRSPQKTGEAGSPFAWINRLGDGLIAGTVEAQPKKPGIFGRGPNFTAPTGFVRYFQSNDYVEAMDAADLRIKVQRQPNFDSADLAFWSKLARKTLVESRSIGNVQESAGAESIMLRGQREIAGKPYEYLLTLRRTKDSIFTFEAWGPKEQFAARERELMAAGESVGK